MPRWLPGRAARLRRQGLVTWGRGTREMMGRDGREREGERDGEMNSRPDSTSCGAVVSVLAVALRYCLEAFEAI